MEAIRQWVCLQVFVVGIPLPDRVTTLHTLHPQGPFSFFAFETLERPGRHQAVVQ